VFALTVDDAWSVFEIAALPAAHPDARPPGLKRRPIVGTPLRCGVPRAADLEFFGDAAAEKAYARARETLASLGADLVEIDDTPFSETGRLLYEGPWLAERLAAIRPFYESSSAELNPVVRDIIGGGSRFSATVVFEGQHRLRTLKKRCAEVWKQIDVLVVPTAGTLYRIEQIAAEPVTLNSNLGRYTNFVNLLDLAAVAVPAGFRDDGLPFGITFIAPAFEDALLVHWGSRFHERCRLPLGATGRRPRRGSDFQAPPTATTLEAAR
jgi:allophanate hydrolase